MIKRETKKNFLGIKGKPTPIAKFREISRASIEVEPK